MQELINLANFLPLGDFILTFFLIFFGWKNFIEPQLRMTQENQLLQQEEIKGLRKENTDLRAEIAFIKGEQSSTDKLISAMSSLEQRILDKIN
jgi:cell division protein FtsB